MELSQFIDRAITVPFVIGGRDYAGWDCWGLVFCAYRDVFNTPLKSYGLEYDPKLSYAEVSDLINRERSEWQSIDQPVAGDVGLYRVGKHETHVALIVAAKRMLHCEQRAGTVCERLDNLIWGGRNVGYFRRG